ncbi:MAG: dephospho-CoA kinase [Porphyromonadaceae bacterium]|nr:dephospho-CoA kinase [Porphyromonadaceae bacterium]
MKQIPIKIGLTGGIGSGKSTISKLLTLYELPLYDSDSNAKRLMETDSEIIARISLLFGEKSYIEGKLNRQLLAEQVFVSADKLHKLNNIVHSAVIDDFHRWVEDQNNKAVVFESAIIFENHLEEHFDTTIAVISPKRLRLERVKHRSGLSNKEILNRIANQASNRTLREKADFIIVNNEKSAVIPQIEFILRHILNI